MQRSTRNVRPFIFFLLTFFLSWLIWVPLDLAHFGIGGLAIPEGISNIVRLLGVLMPAVAALILTRHAGGGEAIKNLLGRLATWRVGWKWWLAAGLIQPALLILSSLIYNLVSGDTPIALLSPGPIAAIVVNIFFLLLATLGEEIGWRGVALPSLLSKHGPFSSSLILGLLWGAWHIPFWLLLDTFDQFGVQYLLLNFLLGFPLTFFFTWVFNHTRSSLLMPVVIHITFNIVNTIFLPVTVIPGPFLVFILLEWIMAFVIVRRSSN